jgi:hypothetical protein
VQVAQVDVRELRTELVAQLLAGAGCHVTQRADHPGGIASQARQPVGAQDDQAHDGEHEELHRPDVEHVASVGPNADGAAVRGV